MCYICIVKINDKDMWIGRTLKGDLWLFVTKPTKGSVSFIYEGQSMVIDRNLYPEVTFWNSPQEVELIIKK